MKTNQLKFILGIVLSVTTSCALDFQFEEEGSLNGYGSKEGAGKGHLYPGVGATNVPIGDAVIARITNALEGNASTATSPQPLAGNFQASLTQFRTNLMRVTDPDASGFGAAQLVGYAACSDLTTGGTPLSQSRYGVVGANAPSTNQNAFIEAGMRILNRQLAGLATQEPVQTQIRSIFSSVYSEVLASLPSNLANANRNRVIFMAVCMAAVSSPYLMGF